MVKKSPTNIPANPELSGSAGDPFPQTPSQNSITRAALQNPVASPAVPSAGPASSPAPVSATAQTTQEGVPSVRASHSARYEAPRPEILQSLRENAAPRRPVAPPIIEPPRARDEKNGAWPFYLGLGLTSLWFFIVLVFSGGALATGEIFGQPVMTVALGIAGAVAPVAFLWMVIAYFQRARDVRAVTEPLRRQLQMVLGTGVHAEARVKRFNDALERQLELMRQAGDGSYDVLQNAIQILQDEERAIGSLADRSGREIQRVAGLVRDNSEILESLLHENQERFSEISGRIAGHIATLDERSNSAAGRLTEMIERLTSFVDDFKNTADKKLIECAGISSEISRQEKDTESSSRRMHEMLSAARLGAAELSQVLQKNQETLDHSSGKLAQRMQEISREIESFTAANQKKEENFTEKSKNLSETLAREIAALEALTHRLDGQMEEASKGFGQRAFALDAKQAELAEKAGSLIQGLQNVIKELDETSAAAFGKFTHIRDTVAQQATQAGAAFKTSGTQYEAMADKLDAISKNVVARVETLGEKLAAQIDGIAGGSQRAVDAAASAEGSVGRALAGLEVMITRIFEAEKMVHNGAGTIVQSFERSFGDFTVLSEKHIARLHAEHDRFEEANQNLATKAREAEGTWQSLVSAAGAQQQTLQEQLKGKIEEAVGLINQTAVAIETARDDIYAHVEAGLSRSGEMAQTLSRLGEMSSAPFAEAAARVKNAVEEGERHLAHFASSLHRNAGEVSELNERMIKQSEETGMKAAETLAGLDAIAARMEAIQHDSSRSTSDVLERLDVMSRHVETRIGEIGHTADTEQKRLAETVRQLSFDINGLIHDSQVADTRVRMAATLLSEQAEEIRKDLGNQAHGIEGSLTVLHGRFADIAEQMRVTTNATHRQIDDISSRYSAIVEMSQQGIEEKIGHLDHIIHGAHETLDNFGGAIDARGLQFRQLDGQVKDSQQNMESSAQAALDRLSVFTHALTASRSHSAETAQEIFARLSDVQEQFNRQIEAVGEGSRTIAADMRQAVQDIVEQSVGLTAVSQQTEGRVANLAAATAELQNRAEATRDAVEAQAARMQERMETVAARIESANFSLERSAAVTFDRTEGMARRFENISEEAFLRLSDTATELDRVAENSVTRASEVNRTLTDQIASLTFAGEHLAEMDTELRKNAEASTATLDRLAREAGSTAAFAAEQLRAQISGLKSEAEGMLTRFETLGQGLAHQSLGILDITVGLEEKIGHLNATATAVYENTHRAGQSIVSSTLEFKNEVSSAVQSMAATGEALQQRGDFTISMVHQMAQRFTEATQNLREQFEGEGKRLADVAASAQHQIQSFAAELARGTSELDAVSTKMGGTGQQVSETLEKANFLLRNIGGQIDRMRVGAESISGSLIERMTETITAFEEELKNLTETTDAGFDGLSQKVKGIGAVIRQDAAAAASDVVASLAKLRGEMEHDFSDVSEQAAGAILKLREQGTAAAGALQDEFRTNVISMAEALTRHLRQVQEHSGSLIEGIRDGAAANAEEAMKMLADLRRISEEEVQGMKTAVETSFEEMQQGVTRLRSNIREGKGEISEAAVEAFAVMRDRMEVEVRGILTRSEGALRQLQESCTGMTRELERSMSEAENTSRNFGAVSENIRTEAGRISHTVAEAGQSMSATHSLLQRSQGALYDVAQKSNEALNIFNDSITQQTKSLAALQQNVTATTGQMSEADQRLSAIKSGFTGVLDDLTQRLSRSMVELEKNILQVRSESEEAARDVTRHGQDIAAQHEAIRMTADALAKALADLESVNRNVSRNMTDQARAALSAARVTPPGAQAALPPVPRMMAPASPVQAPPHGRETPEETLRRLRALGARVPPAAPASMPAAGAKPVAPATPPPAAAARSDTDLIHSLTQIIQQLEETPGNVPSTPGKQKKIG